MLLAMTTHVIFSAPTSVSLSSFVFLLLQVAFAALFGSLALSGCCCRKKGGKAKGKCKGKDGKKGNDDENDEDEEDEDLKSKKPANKHSPAAGPQPRAPNTGGVAGTQDPNYQTLAGIGPDVFGQDKAGGGGGGGGALGGGPKAPVAAGGMAGTADPNYQTLAGIGGDVFQQKGGAGGGGGGGIGPAVPQAPMGGGIAGVNDPNYQTLAGIGGDVFKK